MKRKIVSILCIALVLSVAVAVSGEPILMVVNKSDETLQIFDATTYESIGIVRTGEGPHEVVAAPNGRMAYVGDFNSHENTISVIDLKDMLRVSTIKVNPVWSPHGLAITKDGSKLYATAERSMAVVEIDLQKGEVLRVLKTGQRVTHLLVLTPDEKTLFTSNQGGSNVTVFDLETGDRERNIPAGRGSGGIDITPDGKQLWVTNSSAEDISVINVETRRKTDTIPCSGFPVRLQFTPDGKEAWVTCSRAGQVVVLDTETHEIITRKRSGNRPVGIMIEPSGKRVFVANQDDNEIAVFDRATKKIIKTIATGVAPDGMAFADR